MMRIQSGYVAALRYTLYDESGEIIEQVSPDEPFLYLHGHDNILPNLEVALTDLEVGATFNVKLSPEEAYGVFNPQFQQRVERSEFPDDMELEAGMAFELIAESEEETALLGEEGNSMIFYVKEVGDDDVLIDANHPLAGKTLRFEGEVADIREATAEELDHGHAHYPGMEHH